MFAPALNNNWAMAVCLVLVATWRGVFPSWSWASTFAPSAIKTSTASRCSSAQAQCIGVWPFYEFTMKFPIDIIIFTYYRIDRWLWTADLSIRSNFEIIVKMCFDRYFFAIKDQMVWFKGRCIRTVWIVQANWQGWMYDSWKWEAGSIDKTTRVP